MNTMKDLRREVRHRLHETLDGREIDMMNGVTPRLAHMMGVTDMDTIHTYDDEKGTLFDPTHEFWQEYEDDVDTKAGCERKLESAVRSLKEDGLFRMTYPYGEEADIVYCEVEPVEENDADDTGSSPSLQSSCPKCGHTLDPSPNLELSTSSANLRLSVDCDKCDFSTTYEGVMYRL